MCRLSWTSQLLHGVGVVVLLLSDWSHLQRKITWESLTGCRAVHVILMLYCSPPAVVPVTLSQDYSYPEFHTRKLGNQDRGDRRVDGQRPPSGRDFVRLTLGCARVNRRHLSVCVWCSSHRLLWLELKNTRNSTQREPQVSG